MEARYDGGMYFYPGKVTRRNPDGTLDILYDDGEQETVARSLVRLEKACARPLKTAPGAAQCGERTTALLLAPEQRCRWSSKL